MQEYWGELLRRVGFPGPALAEVASRIASAIIFCTEGSLPPECHALHARVRDLPIGQRVAGLVQAVLETEDEAFAREVSFQLYKLELTPLFRELFPELAGESK